MARPAVQHEIHPIYRTPEFRIFPFDEALSRLELLVEQEQQRRGEQIVDVTRDAERADRLAQDLGGWGLPTAPIET